MAELHVQNLRISYAGPKKAVRELKRALKEQKSQAVKAALAYIEDLGGISVEGSFFVEEFDLPDPDAFVSLSREFPKVAFIFDFSYSGQAAGCEGDGRYYCVYEGGKKVYDAGGWCEQYAHLNQWLQGLRVEGDFYRADEKETKALIARGRLVEQGKKPAEITKKDLEAFIAGFDPDLMKGIEMCVPCRFAEFRAYGFETYEDSWRDLNDGDEGYDDYRDLKEAGTLPRFKAKHNRFSYDYEESAGGEDEEGAEFDAGGWDDNGNREREGDDEEGWDDKRIRGIYEESEVVVDTEEESDEDAESRLLQAVRSDGNALAQVPAEQRSKILCLEAVKQNGWALQYVPAPLKTASLCLEAVKQHWAALYFTPLALQTPDFWAKALPYHRQVAEFMPIEKGREKQISREAPER